MRGFSTRDFEKANVAFGKAPCLNGEKLFAKCPFCSSRKEPAFQCEKEEKYFLGWSKLFCNPESVCFGDESLGPAAKWGAYRGVQLSLVLPFFVLVWTLRLLAFVNVCLHLFAFARICLRPPFVPPPPSA